MPKPNKSRSAEQGGDRKRGERADQSALRPRTAEDIANEQTTEHLALRIWAAMVAEKVLSGMSALMDELIESHLLDDDDEEGDEGWIDDHHKREKAMLDEGITYGLRKYATIGAINELPRDELPQDLAPEAEQLRDILTKCAIGATEFEKKCSREQLGRLIRRDLKTRFEKDPKFRTHVAEDVPGADVKRYGPQGRTSSKGTFAKADNFESGGGLAALFTGGWLRVAKDRIDPIAWSYRFGPGRKSDRQAWRHCFHIIERDGRRSFLELPREKLAGNGAAAIRLLMKAGVHVVRRDAAIKALARFLYFKPTREIVRMSRVGWAQVGSHWIFVRPDEVITPLDMPRARDTTYVLDAAATRHGLHVAGTTKQWAHEVAAPLRGNANVALSFATFFATPLLRWASEPGGGVHLHGTSTIGKTWASDVGQSIYGWPYETADDAFGVSWGGSEAGSDAFTQGRTDLGIALDEITRADRRKAEEIVYTIASGTRGPRAKSTGQLRETAHANVLVLSTGEKSLVEFIGPSLQEGARKRLVDVPAEVQPGSAFETIPRDQIHAESKRSFDAVKRQHGAVGRDWQRHLVNLGPDEIKSQLHKHREAFLALPEVVAVAEKAHPQVRAVVNRFALYDAALRMAIAAGLLPWTVEEADSGIAACVRRWVKQRGNIDTAGELVRAVHGFKAAINAALADRFIHVGKVAGQWAPMTAADEIKQRTPELFDGYAKPDRVLVRPEAWRRLSNGIDVAEIARHLQQQGALIADVRGGKLSRSEKVLRKTERFYVLKRASLA